MNRTNDQRFEFLACASHELRTPVNGIVGITSLLQDTPLNDEQREYVQTIRSCSDALLTVINDILDLAQINAGKITLETSRFNLTTLVEECMDIVAPMLGNKPVCMYNLTSREASGEFYGDPARIRQIICNLLSNAAKFTKQGTIAINASSTFESGKQMLHISVRDSGCGIPPEKQNLLFQPFSRISRPDGDRPGGSGLGLMISQHLASLMGGTLTVRSEDGKGSCFTLSMPVVRPVKSQNADASNPWTDRQVSVYLVTSDEHLTKAVSDMVAGSLGFIPIHVPGSAQSGLKFPDRQGERSVLIIDEQVVKASFASESGPDRVLTFIKRLREKSDCRQTPVVLLRSPGQTFDESLDESGISSIRRTPLKESVLISYMRELADIPDHEHNFSKNERERRQRLSHHFDKNQFRNVRILVADDNPLNRKVMETILTKMGINADFADSGRDAVMAAESHCYPLILMDCQMPEMDGLEATRLIRHLPGYRHIPILALTADSLGEAREEALAAGMTEYLVKPIDIRQLHLLMQRYLSAPPVIRRASSLPANDIRIES